MTKANPLNSITVTIPTLNEEKNIIPCINSIRLCGIKNILVIDGGSSDTTLEKLKSLKVRFIALKHKKGLAYQRMIGIKKTRTKFVALIDADMRPEKSCFKKMLKDLENSKFAGVEAKIKSNTKKSNYFDKSYQEIMEININKKGERRMIGTPTLWYTKILKRNNFDPFFTGPSDDTDVCYRIYKKGYIFGGSSAICFHVHRSTVYQYIKKYIWYGKGDALFVIRHPERFLSIIKHQLYNYPIKFSYYSLKKFNLFCIPFMFLAGSLRFIGMNLEFLKKILRVSDKIYST